MTLKSKPAAFLLDFISYSEDRNDVLLKKRRNVSETVVFIHLLVSFVHET
jgi:hypothetical protein